MKAKHPAPYSPTVLEAFKKHLDAEATRLGRAVTVLDPMAGTGRIHQLAAADRIYTVGVEIEKLWAAMHPHTMHMDATKLRFLTGTFDVVAVSPSFGNRYADSHKAKDGSERRSYTHDLRATAEDENVELQANNTGRLYFWQPAYRELHAAAWAEAVRVLRPRGMFLLDTSNFICRGPKGASYQRPVPPAEEGGKVRQEWMVTAWHRDKLTELGLEIVAVEKVCIPRMRKGQNGQQRVEATDITVFRKPQS